MNIKLVKLIDGEEVVCEARTDGDTIVMKNPIRLVPVQDGLGMVPFSPFAKTNEFTIPSRFVMYVVEVEEEIAGEYNKKFGTIVTAPAAVLQNLKLVRP